MLEILRAKQTEQYPVGEWYLGALIALNNKLNPERLAQAGNSLRELLENIPKWTGVEIQRVDKPAYDAARSVVIDGVSTCKSGNYRDGWKGEITPPLVKTMVSLEAYLKLSEGPNRQENTAQGIAKSNPLYKYTDQDDRERSIRRLAKCSGIFQKFTHHIMSAKHEATFLETLAETEKLLAEIFNPSAVDVQTAIREVVKKDPNEFETQQLNGIFDLIGQRLADYDFFFRNLQNPKWIQPLSERGFFSTPPSVKDAGGGYVQLPPWLPLNFLVRVAKEAPAEAVAICLSIPPTDNIRVYGEIHNVALAVPDVEMSIALVDKIAEGITAKYHLLGDGYHKLVARWAGHDASVKAALTLAKRLLHFQADPRQEEKLTRRKSDPMAWDTILEPKPPFDSWEYHRILSEGVIPLARRAPLKTSLLLIECLVEFLRLKIHEWQLTLEDEAGEDYSSIWCKRVDGPVGEYLDPDEALIHTMTAACEECCRRNDPELAIKINAALTEPGWKIFERVRHHLYAKFPALFRDQIRIDILSYDGYAEKEYDREQAEMIREACRHYGSDLFSPEEYDGIVNAILRGPDREEFREHLGERDSDERYASRRDWLHRQQLWPFESILSGAGLARFQEANQSVTEEATINGYSPIDMGGVHEVTSDSPTAANDLEAKSDDDLIQFLNEWDQSGRSSTNHWVTIDRNGLAGAFAKCIANDIDRFAKWDEQWTRITRPIFLRAAIDYATMQVEAKNYQGIEGWFRLCRVILAKNIPLDIDPRELSDESDSSPALGKASIWRPSLRRGMSQARQRIPPFLYFGTLLDRSQPLHGLRFDPGSARIDLPGKRRSDWHGHQHN